MALDISQGDVYWLDLETPVGSAPDFRRPVVVVQNDLFNKSPIQTTVVCTLTTSLRLAKAPGNVLLKAAVAGIPRDSIANVSQVYTVDKERLTEWIASLPGDLVDEIVEGLRYLIEPRSL